MNTHTRRFFDSLSDGLILLNETQQVRYMNPAAQGWLPCRYDEVLAGLDLSDQIRALKMGKNSVACPLPGTLATRESAAGNLIMRMLNSPVAGEYLLLIQQTDGVSADKNRFANFAALLQDQLQAPAALVQARAQAMTFPGIPHPSSLDAHLNIQRIALEHALDDLMTRVTDIARLAEAWHLTRLDTPQPVELPGLIEATLLACRPTLCRHGIRICLAGLDSPLPVLWGNPRFLADTLASLLREMAIQGPAHRSFQLSLTPGPCFVEIALQDYSPQADFSPTEEPPPDPLSTSLENGLHLNLVICQRVIALHRGDLHIHRSNGRITSLTVRLPHERPLPDPSSQAMQQAMRYAQDLLTLIQNQRHATITERS